jgi:hypothetical protein
VLGDDLVAGEPRRAGAGVGDQRLAGVQFQLEGFSQERRQRGLDLLGFAWLPQLAGCIVRVST